MKTLVYTQPVILHVEVPNNLPETAEALEAYMERHQRWPNITDGDWQSIEDIWRIES
jgi:hypothetical protein